MPRKPEETGYIQLLPSPIPEVKFTFVNRSYRKSRMLMGKKLATKEATRELFSEK
jgi:hypothetical protein